MIVAGLVLIAAGVLIGLGDRIPFRIGRLPGDFVYRGKNTTVYFPFATGILLSVVLTLVLWIVNRLR